MVRLKVQENLMEGFGIDSDENDLEDLDDDLDDDPVDDGSEEEENY